MHLLSKTDNHLVNVSDCLVILKCGTATAKTPEFLDHHLQPIMRSDDDFLLKIKNSKKELDNTILITINIVGLYPSIPLNESLEILKKQLDNFNQKKKTF